MTHLTINARYKNRPMTGVERFAFEVEAELRKRLDFEVSEVNPEREISGLKGHFWEQLVLPKSLAKNSLLFSPCNTGPVSVRDQMVVIHDAAVWDYPEGFSRQFGTVYRNMLPLLAAKCRHVATVSQFSRDRLAHYLKIPADKILVLGNAAGPEFKPAATSPAPQSPRFFTVSSLDPRKNFERLIQVWDQLDSQKALPEGSELRIAGGANPRNFSAVATEGCESVKWLGRISDEELILEYQAATGFLFPSLYEGFGIPPLEAMACGCPVLMSDRASLPEVGGSAFSPENNPDGAAIYFDPEDNASIANAITSFIQLSPANLETLKTNVLQRSSGFSWKRISDQVAQAISG